MPWGRARLAAVEKGRSRQAARQLPVVQDREQADQEVPVVMPDVRLGKSPFLPLRAETGRGQHPAAPGMMQASMEESRALWYPGRHSLHGKVERIGLSRLEERRMRADMAMCQICKDGH